MSRAKIITNVALALACIGAVYVASEAQQALDDTKAKWRPAAPALRGTVQAEQVNRDARNFERSMVGTSSPPAPICTTVRVPGDPSRGTIMCARPGGAGGNYEIYCAGEPTLARLLGVKLCDLVQG